MKRFLSTASCLFSVAALLLLPSTKLSAQSAQQSDYPFAPAQQLMEQGKFADAVAAMEELGKSKQDFKGLSKELGFAFYRKWDYVNAVAYLQKAIKENPEDGEAIQLTGLSLYLAGKPREAIPYLEKVQSWYPNANVDAAYILGVAYIQTKNYPQARAAFAKMFGVPEESAASYLFTARMLFRLEFGPVAEEYAQKAVSIDPKLPLAHFLLGELYLFQSKIPDAIKQFQQELEINPGNAASYYKLADAYSRVQKYDEAEKLLQRSIWLDATSTGPYILMGKVLQKKGEPLLAVRALQRAISMDASNAISHHLLGQAYRDLGRAED